MPHPGPADPQAFDSGRAEHCFRLYVSTASPLSQRAIAKARGQLQQLLPDRHSLAIVSIADHVDAARADQVIVSPTLLRVSPLPQRRFIGDLSDSDRLRQGLGLPAPRA